ncbi:DUF4355 domain-containing protein [Vagococcus lutrae]|uniref:DUF4355 domain-containing protein n=1 Tax=Vagococcus lutrae TaxID=81947 RepID=UPI00288E1990|nr:DUF4355 domain-containing protein [Vagococcus lutrae]MDT2805247.1 DUF4355 domain-containing protein [Vagococcus lutrae]MDT2816289.1 DUF4355 domain-containing protein [Vagococcus lutrae]
MKHIKLLSMDLQRFADDVDNPDVDETSKDEKIKDDEKQEKTFTRAELGKVIAAEKAKWEKDFEAKLEKEKSEAARLAKLSKDEREKEEENKRIKAIEERERNVQLAELRIETKSELANSGLPESFVDFVLTEKAEDIQSNIANLKKHFDEELEKAVNLRLVQKQTKVGTGGGSLTKAQIMEIKDSRERQKAIAENRHLF